MSLEEQAKRMAIEKILEELREALSNAASYLGGIISYEVERVGFLDPDAGKRMLEGFLKLIDEYERRLSWYVEEPLLSALIEENVPPEAKSLIATLAQPPPPIEVYEEALEEARRRREELLEMIKREEDPEALRLLLDQLSKVESQIYALERLVEKMRARAAPPPWPTVRLRVEGEAIGDARYRFYGLGVDQDLDRYFWRTQPHAIRKVVYRRFTDEVEVPATTTNLVVGVSATSGRWHVKVYAEGRLIAEGDVAVPGAYPGSPGYLKASIAPPAPPVTPPVAPPATPPVMPPVMPPAAPPRYPSIKIVEARFPTTLKVNEAREWLVAVSNVGGAGAGGVRICLASGPATMKVIVDETVHDVPVGGELLMYAMNLAEGATSAHSGRVAFTVAGSYSIRIEAVHLENGSAVVDEYADCAVEVEEAVPAAVAPPPAPPVAPPVAPPAPPAVPAAVAVAMGLGAIALAVTSFIMAKKAKKR